MRKGDMGVDLDLIRLGERPRLVPYLRTIWERREFAIDVPLNQWRAQNMNTVFGNLWHLLNPLLLIGVYYLLFAVILQVDRGVDNFLGFLAVGIFTFHFTQKSVLAGAKTIVANEGLIRSIAFPRAILPLSAVIKETLSLGPSIVVMLAVALITGEPIRASWVLLPVFFVLQAVFTLGLTLIFARLADQFHDIVNILPFVFRILLYGSGVLYPVTRLLNSGMAAVFFEWNPFYGFITLVRGPILGNDLDVGVLLVCCVWTVVTMAFGMSFFLAYEHRYGRG